MEERNLFFTVNPLPLKCHILTHLRYIAVVNIVRKGEIA